MSSITERYHAAAHAMQSGVALEHTRGSNDGSPKHLRVGINTALVEHAALVELLIAKGILTGDEYSEAVVQALEREVARYEERLGLQPGTLR